MSSHIIFAKAVAVSSLAMFTLLWLVNGFVSALLLSFYTLSFLLIAAAVLAATVTLTFMFYDWKNKYNAKPNSTNRTGHTAG